MVLTNFESDVWVHLLVVQLTEHLHLMDLLVHALDRDQVLHIALSNSLTLAVDAESLHHPKVLSLSIWLSFVIWSLLILHLIFQVIEYTVKVNRIELHWHL